MRGQTGKRPLKHAEVISQAEEELLWSSEVMGLHSLKALFHTISFLTLIGRIIIIQLLHSTYRILRMRARRRMLFGMIETPLCSS